MEWESNQISHTPDAPLPLSDVTDMYTSPIQGSDAVEPAIMQDSNVNVLERFWVIGP